MKNEYPHTSEYLELQRKPPNWQIESIDILQSEYNEQDNVLLYKSRVRLSQRIFPPPGFKKISIENTVQMPISKEYCDTLEQQIISEKSKFPPR